MVRVDQKRMKYMHWFRKRTIPTSKVYICYIDKARSLGNQIRKIGDLRQLVEADADANLPDEKGRLPIFKATKQSLHAKILFYLAEKNKLLESQRL